MCRKPDRSSSEIHTSENEEERMNRRSLLQRIWQVLFLQNRESANIPQPLPGCWVPVYLQMLVALVIGGLVALPRPEKYGTYNYVSALAIFLCPVSHRNCYGGGEDMGGRRDRLPDSNGHRFHVGNLPENGISACSCLYFLWKMRAVRMLLLIKPDYRRSSIYRGSSTGLSGQGEAERLCAGTNDQRLNADQRFATS